MDNISPRFRWNESQYIRLASEGSSALKMQIPDYDNQIAAAASLLLVLITIGYIYRREVENLIPLKQWGFLGHRLQNTEEHPRVSNQAPNKQVQADKVLYYQLQNLSSNPECLPQARNRLLELLDRTVHEAVTGPISPNSILSVPRYSAEALHTFLHNAANATSDGFAQYTARRKAGGPREMLPTLEYAKYWIRLAAPVKYVDGSWLGGIHRLSTTPEHHRVASRIAWQILSEELGDGDIGKNHVAVYEKLINSIGSSSIGLGHQERFIKNMHNPNQDPRVWTAAVSQLLISIFPDEMLPEMLGFNMAYESLPSHLLITIQEMKELDLDPYYFILHVSIDNGHSGHAAMGAAAVIKYIDALKSEEEKETAWRRVQAGYIMAEGLPTTPTSITELDKEVERIFKEKCETSKPMHTFCNGNIGGSNVFGKNLTQWLDPERFDEWGLVFVKTIADSRWVEKGNPSESKLVKELQWGGRMFGAYTSEEVGILEKWIQGLKKIDTFPDSKGAYEKFTGKELSSVSLPSFPTPINPSTTHRVHTTLQLRKPSLLSQLSHPQLPPTITALPSTILGTLLMLSGTPFEQFPSYPSHISTSEGMAAIRTLRALYGFLPENDLCAGMDEVLRLPDDVIGVVELGGRLGGKRPTEIESSHPLASLCEYVTRLSKFPQLEVSRLLGCQIGFVSCVLSTESGLWDGTQGARESLLAPKERAATENIGARILEAWQDILKANNSPINQGEVLEGWNAVVSYIAEIIIHANETYVAKQRKGLTRHPIDSGVDLLKSAVKFTDDIRGVYTADCGLRRTKHPK